jgi:hypothetical protein
MQTNRLFLIGETVGVYSKNHTKHVNTLCGQKRGVFYEATFVHFSIWSDYLNDINLNIALNHYYASLKTFE